MSVQQTISILRSEDNDEMMIHRRYCDRQPTDTRLCGYYATAAAISVCHNADPMGDMCDEEMTASIQSTWCQSSVKKVASTGALNTNANSTAFAIRKPILER